MSLLRFGFTALGKTRDEVIEELDAQVQALMLNLDGEPWITVVDDYRLVPLTHDFTNPDAFVYRGEREVWFGGPTVLGDLKPWRDGFRPQGGEDYPDSFS